MGDIMNVKAILLDMDGTLVDSSAVVERLWTEWGESHGLDPERVLSVIHGRQGQESMAVLLPERDHELNLAENQAMLAREVRELDGVHGVPGAQAFLRALEGTPHALVTSATLELATARMTAAGVPLPPLMVSAEDVQNSKPHPEGFLAAARALGAAPEECVVFDDSSAGIAAARAAGMTVVGVGTASAAHGPDVHVEDLTGVEVARDGEQVVLRFP
ncbi:HAD family hydrolase [Arthrobacter woluwensis]|uniref:HAD-IA family hydrolase n=1 Tax=Arthrobacter woluwensis TaxID=156980 RepID=UPI000D11C91D|nr:HAD-IA family hydrolase [Arthrobacter woluwensis]PSS44484.1 HAD family hydrolase [Arthrobacter woluwensis]